MCICPTTHKRNTHVCKWCLHSCVLAHNRRPQNDSRSLAGSTAATIIICANVRALFDFASNVCVLSRWEMKKSHTHPSERRVELAEQRKTSSRWRFRRDALTKPNTHTNITIVFALRLCRTQKLSTPIFNTHFQYIKSKFVCFSRWQWNTWNMYARWFFFPCTCVLIPTPFLLSSPTRQANLTHIPRSEYVPGIGLGIAKCPYDPQDNSTAIYVENGNPGGLPALVSALWLHAYDTLPYDDRMHVHTHMWWCSVRVRHLCTTHTHTHMITLHIRANTPPAR